MTRPYALDILVPSRGRPHSIHRLIRAISDTAAHPERIRVMVRTDDDDPAQDQYFRMPPAPGWMITRGPRIRLAESWNEQAAQAAENGVTTHLALWGDDVIPVTPGWDRTFIERLDQDGPGFVYGRDGVWDHTFNQSVPGHLVLPTAVVMPIEVYRALGWIAPAGLIHLCIDVAWRDLGIACDALHYEPGVFIRHFHRLCGAPDDATYREANDSSAQVNADNRAFRAWRESDRFELDRGNLLRLREKWIAEQEA
ncbi:MAG TPA: hypothetical protein VFP28_02565 [Gemmatimonadales bacterium]|nr:hypothetical protein [Gemmatimonadales bacterium]